MRSNENGILVRHLHLYSSDLTLIYVVLRVAHHLTYGIIDVPGFGTPMLAMLIPQAHTFHLVNWYVLFKYTILIRQYHSVCSFISLSSHPQST